MPANGPIKAALTELIEATSNSPSGALAHCSSIAQVIPMINGLGVVAQLKNSRWRLTPAFIFASSSPYSSRIAGIIVQA